MRKRTAIAAIAVASGVMIAGAARTLLVPDPFAFAGTRHIPLTQYAEADPTGAPAGGSDPIARGRYLTLAADCRACHTVPGGPQFAGGNAFVLPFGTLYSPNITPDRKAGIGAWSDADFLRAVHRGIAPGGVNLYPAFPYPDYTYLTDDDVLAIKAYLFSLPASDAPSRPAALRFPFNQRKLMAIWSLLYNPNRRFQPFADRSAQWNRGAYLAEALEHCGECHTSRNLMQAVDNRHKFGGAVTGGWRAFNISRDPGAGVGRWTDAELTQYLRWGHAAGRGTATGPMGEAVDQSLQYLTDSDIRAMVVYLRSIPAVTEARELQAQPPATPLSARSIQSLRLGETLYEGACIGCHTRSGFGTELPYATLIGSAAVADATATNVIKVLLEGAHRPALAPEANMPAFASRYTNAELAAVAIFVTTRFGGHPATITARTIQKARAD